MIELHIKNGQDSSEKLEKRLEDLVIAYKKEVHSGDTSGLPYIVEDGEVYRSQKEIDEWLNELSSELSWQRSLSGDGCYIDPNNGKVC